MTCNMPCLNGGTCISNDTCICPPCFMGQKCEFNINIVQFSLTYVIHWDIRQANSSSNFNSTEFIYIMIIALMLLIALINNFTCLQTFLLPDIRLTNCGIFQIFYCITGLMTIVGMQLRMLTMLKFDFLTQTYSYRYIACNIIPVLVIIMGDTCMWISVLLVIEFVLLEWFNLNLYRSRRFSMISSLICIILISGSHLHEIIARRPLPDPHYIKSYSCTFIYPLPLDIIDKVLRACQVIIPCAIHFIASVCILISITRRIIIVRGRKDFCRIFLSECLKRRYMFVPPLFIILSNLPHLILHLKDACEDARDLSLLRIHVSFNILVYLPPTITFFIYIYPSKSYMHKFQKTWMGRRLKCLFQKQKKVNVWNIKLPVESRQALTINTSVMMTNDILC